MFLNYEITAESIFETKQKITEQNLHLIHVKIDLKKKTTRYDIFIIMFSRLFSLRRAINICIYNLIVILFRFRSRRRYLFGLRWELLPRPCQAAARGLSTICLLRIRLRNKNIKT